MIQTPPPPPPHIPIQKYNLSHHSKKLALRHQIRSRSAHVAGCAKLRSLAVISPRRPLYSFTLNCGFPPLPTLVQLFGHRQKLSKIDAHDETVLKQKDANSNHTQPPKNPITSSHLVASFDHLRYVRRLLNGHPPGWR